MRNAHMTSPCTEVLLKTEAYAQSFIWASLQSMPGMISVERHEAEHIRLQFQADADGHARLTEKLQGMPGLVHWQRMD